MTNPTIDPYLAKAMQAAVPPDNAIRTGRVEAIDGGSVRVLVNGGVVPAGYLTSYVPQVGDTVALSRQGADWLVLGSLYGDAAPNPENPFADDWHLFDLQNSWTHRSGTPGFQYRFAWDPNFIMIMGQIIPGTIADNTLIATLPQAYRPDHESLFVARKTAGAYCIFAIQNDGSVRIYDSAGSTVVQAPLTIISLHPILT